MSSLIQKNIDQIIRTKTTLAGTERFPGRDATGDFKITLANFITAISGYLIGQRVGTLLISQEKIALSSYTPYWNLSNPTQPITPSILPDYVAYKRSLLAETKWASTYETTGTTSGSPLKTLTLAASKSWSAGQVIFLSGQFRMIVSGGGTSYVIDEPITASSAKIWSISTASSVSNFPITGYSRTSNTVSLFANSNTAFPELYIMLMNLAEDYYQDRAYRTLTLPEGIGSGDGLIPAGEYQILSVTPANVGTSSAVLTFTYAGSNVSLTALTSKYLNFYPHRIAGSSNAMHYRISDMALMNDGLYNIAGYRSRDVIIGHKHSYSIGTNIVTDGWVVRNTSGGQLSISFGSSPAGDLAIESPIADGVNPTPNTGPRTKPRSSIYNYYEYVGEVVS